MTEPTPTSSPPPAPAAGGGGSGLAVGPGTILALLGAVALVVSAFLNWLEIDGIPSSPGTDVPFDFLFDKGTNSSDPSFLLWLGIAAALLAVGALVPRVRVLAIVGGVLGVLVAVVYCIQLNALLDDRGIDVDLLDAIGIGVYVALVAGAVGLIGSLLPRNT